MTEKERLALQAIALVPEAYSNRHPQFIIDKMQQIAQESLEGTWDNVAFGKQLAADGMERDRKACEGKKCMVSFTVEQEGSLSPLTVEFDVAPYLYPNVGGS